MKVLVEIPDKIPATPILEMLKAFVSVTTTKLSAEEVAALNEIKHIKEAHMLAGRVKSGQIKTRPARTLLNEL